MAVVPILPTQNVPQKPDDAKVVEGVGLVIGMLLGEGQGVPQDLAGNLSPPSPPPGTQWVETPWGKGYKLTGTAYTLGQYNVPPPLTYHVLFKPEPTNPEAMKDALIFGEIHPTSQRPLNGPVFEWIDPSSTSFAAFAADGDPIFSYVPLQPEEHEWYSITVTYDGAEVLFYINGMYTLERAEHESNPVSNRLWSLGGPGFSGGGFSGIIADARIYNRVLAPVEIEQITSGRNMWRHYNGNRKIGHWWRRRTWITPRGAFRLARRVASR